MKALSAVAGSAATAQARRPEPWLSTMAELGSLARVGALDRVRSNPKLSVAIACGVLLVIAWIGWAIYVTGDRGSRAGRGVLLAWPALVAAAALVVLLLYGCYRLVRRLSPSDQGESAAADDDATEVAEEAEA